MRALGIAAIAALILAGAAAGIAAPQQAESVAAPATASSNLDGKQLFIKHCGYCHLPGGTGTIQLKNRWGEERALLADRTDLQADYVKAVARNGIYSMPPITRVEVPDDELEKLAEYLGTADKTGSKGQ